MLQGGHIWHIGALPDRRSDPTKSVLTTGVFTTASRRAWKPVACCRICRACSIWHKSLACRNSRSALSNDNFRVGERAPDVPSNPKHRASGRQRRLALMFPGGDPVHGGGPGTRKSSGDNAVAPNAGPAPKPPCGIVGPRPRWSCRAVGGGSQPRTGSPFAPPGCAKPIPIPGQVATQAESASRRRYNPGW